MVNSGLNRRHFLKSMGAAATGMALQNQAFGQTTSKTPNILWICTEDISPALGAYGDKQATTPNLDQLANEGVLYRHAYASAPICAPARSCLITGVYATSLGTQHLRSEVEIPPFIQAFPKYLQKQGYFCTNLGKTDFNFSPEGVFDYWKHDFAPWRQRKDGQPFFSMINLGLTHEGRLNTADKYEEAVQNLPGNLMHNADELEIPPYYPDTPEIRRVWKHAYDTITAMDRKVGEILQNLKNDGLYEDTIVFFFADHGFGLPRFKRWVNHSGLHVPLIIRVPEAYQHISKHNPGSEAKELVSFVDFAPTVLNIAGAEIPEHMQGQPFLGKSIPEDRNYIFGARSRADDMFELSRAVFDGRYFYIRHYMPHLPYIQDGIIFSDRKLSLKELRRLHQAGQLNPEAEMLWDKHKPLEELYDLETDPHEINNLAASSDHQAIKTRFHERLTEWILEHRDTGFLMEAEYQIRAQKADSTPYQIAQDPAAYDLNACLETAEMVMNPKYPLKAAVERLDHPDSGVRFWAATALLAVPDQAASASGELMDLLNDPSPSARIAASQALCEMGKTKKALDTLAQDLRSDNKYVALQAARAVCLLGKKACPIVPTIKEVLNQFIADPTTQNWGRRYKDFNYAAFTSWSLEWALQNCGEPIPGEEM